MRDSHDQTQRCFRASTCFVAQTRPLGPAVGTHLHSLAVKDSAHRRRCSSWPAQHAQQHIICQQAIRHAASISHRDWLRGRSTLPQGNSLPRFPPRAATSHSASLGKRLPCARQPSREPSHNAPSCSATAHTRHWQYACASVHDKWMAGSIACSALMVLLTLSTTSLLGPVG